MSITYYIVCMLCAGQLLLLVPCVCLVVQLKCYYCRLLIRLGLPGVFFTKKFTKLGPRTVYLWGHNAAETVWWGKGRFTRTRWGSLQCSLIAMSAIQAPYWRFGRPWRNKSTVGVWLRRTNALQVTISVLWWTIRFTAVLLPRAASKTSWYSMALEPVKPRPH